MALTLPLATADLVDLLRIRDVAWNLMDQEEVSGLGSGEGLTADLGPKLWEGECTTVDIRTADLEKWKARFHILDGSNNAFYLYNPSVAYPETDPDGTALAGASVTVLAIEANRKEMSLAGLPAGFVVPWGAYASITGGSPSRTALVHLAADATADGTGETGNVEFRPHLRSWITAGMAVTLIKPVAKVKLVPRSLRSESVGQSTSRLRFTARQTLAAG